MTVPRTTRTAARVRQITPVRAPCTMSRASRPTAASDEEDWSRSRCKTKTETERAKRRPMQNPHRKSRAVLQFLSLFFSEKNKPSHQT